MDGSALCPFHRQSTVSRVQYYVLYCLQFALVCQLVAVGFEVKPQTLNWLHYLLYFPAHKHQVLRDYSPKRINPKGLLIISKMNNLIRNLQLFIAIFIS